MQKVFLYDDLFTRLHLVSRFLGFLLIFLYNAKPSFEIAKWMAKNMLWQNMKINKIMQKPKNLKTYISQILAPKGGAAAKRPPPFLVQILA